MILPCTTHFWEVCYMVGWVEVLDGTRTDRMGRHVFVFCGWLGHYYFLTMTNNNMVAYACHMPSPALPSFPTYSLLPTQVPHTHQGLNRQTGQQQLQHLLPQPTLHPTAPPPPFRPPCLPTYTCIWFSSSSPQLSIPFFWFLPTILFYYPQRPFN